jgi:hypothetical protein
MHNMLIPFSVVYHDFGSFWSQLLHGECGQEIFKWSHISEVDLQLSKSTATLPESVQKNVTYSRGDRTRFFNISSLSWTL